MVFHLQLSRAFAGSWGQMSSGVYINENLLVTQLLLEAVKETGRRPFVFASSSSIYGDAEKLPTSETASPKPVSPYGVSKLAMEHLCRLYSARFDVPTIALRYFTVYGPRQRPDMAFRALHPGGKSGRRGRGVRGRPAKPRLYLRVRRRGGDRRGGLRGRPRRGLQHRGRLAGHRARSVGNS